MANFNNLPAEIQLMIYGHMITPSGPRLVRITGVNQVAEIQLPTSQIRTALQLNSASREMALRHLANSPSSPWTAHCLDSALFNREMDLVYLDKYYFFFGPLGRWMHSHWEEGQDIYAALVLGGDFSNIMITLRRSDLYYLPPANVYHPVDNVADVLADAEDNLYTNRYKDRGGSQERFFHFSPRRPAQLPRNLYIALGGSWGAFRGHEHPAPHEIITQAETADPAIMQSLHAEDRFLVERVMERVQGWEQHFGLQVNVFFVRSTEREIPVEDLLPPLDVTQPHGY